MITFLTKWAAYIRRIKTCCRAAQVRENLGRLFLLAGADTAGFLIYWQLVMKEKTLGKIFSLRFAQETRRFYAATRAI